MTAVISNDINEVNPLIDSILFYDKLPTTCQRIGTLLIERNLDIKRGREFIYDTFSKLTVTKHIFNSYMLLARSDLTLGNFASAKMNFENALSIDSTRAEAWYEYLSFLKMREIPKEANDVLVKIKDLEKQDRLHYANQTNKSSNINKNIHKLTLMDLDSNIVELNSLKGKVVVVNRFNFWCGYCVSEFPTLKKLIKEFPGVKFIFVNSGETTSELRDRYFKKKEFNFLKKQTVLFVTNDYYNNIYGDGVPHTFVVDKNGNIIYDYLGYRKELESLLRTNLKTLSKE